MIDELHKAKERRRQSSAAISFEHSARKTKDLVELSNCSLAFGEHKLFQNLDYKITSGSATALLGPNGCGKTSFIRLITGDLEPTEGHIRRATNLKVSYFSQSDTVEDESLPLGRILLEEGDRVIFQGQEIHINSWAKKFQFSPQMLQVPYAKLSGGEKARARISKVMLEQADVLILDEPSNDLDIGILEVLEESLEDFPGAIVLVTHDRFLLNRVCSAFLGFVREKGAPKLKLFADYMQWERSMQENEEDLDSKPVSDRDVSGEGESLSYEERKELSKIEKKIGKMDKQIANLDSKMAEASSQGDTEKLLELQSEREGKSEKLTELYSAWEALEERR